MTKDAEERLHILRWQRYLSPEEEQEKRQLDNQRDREIKELIRAKNNEQSK